MLELLGIFSLEILDTSGLSTGLILGKAFFILSGKPLFKEALILISSCKPSIVRCFLFLMISKAFLNNK